MRLPNQLTKNSISKFNKILNELEQKYCHEYLDLDTAIKIWCYRLSIDKIFPRKYHNILPTSKKIIKYVNQWLQDNLIVKLFAGIYREILIVTDQNITKGQGNWLFSFQDYPETHFVDNIKEAKSNMERSKMSNKLILLVGFILTGVGLLLFLLNRKENSDSTRANQNITYAPRQSSVTEKYILALLINGDHNQPLINSLKNSSTVTQEDSSQLYDATQALWIGTETEFNNSVIKSEFNNHKHDTVDSEYDVYFVTIELNKHDSRFKQDANQMDRIDAFNGLANNANRITVSERLSSEAYGNSEFYN